MKGSRETNKVIRRYYCVEDTKIGCPAYGLEKKSKDGVGEYAFLGEHTHADENTLKVKTPSIQAKNVEDEAFTMDTKQLMRKTPIDRVLQDAMGMSIGLSQKKILNQLQQLLDGSARKESVWHVFSHEKSMDK